MIRNMKRGIQTVFGAWIAGTSKRDGNVSTDGQTLFSYAMPIARKTNGKILVVRHEDSPSKTTTKHRNYVAGQLAMSGRSFKETSVSVLE